MSDFLFFPLLGKKFGKLYLRLFCKQLFTGIFIFKAILGEGFPPVRFNFSTMFGYKLYNEKAPR